MPVTATEADRTGRPIAMRPQAPPIDWKPVEMKLVPLPERAPDIVVIKYGQGGRVDEHKQRFDDYRRTRAKVEVRGPCYSACTMLLTLRGAGKPLHRGARLHSVPCRARDGARRAHG